MVVKLDMGKAYARVFGIFLTRVLRKFGFSEVIIGMVWRLISSNWYSVLINGQSNSLFSSYRDLKQGDPLSPTLFIIFVKVLARGLNIFHEDNDFIGYRLPKRSPKINHLAYADDTILFCSCDKALVIKMMTILKDMKIFLDKGLTIQRAPFIFIITLL